jgi:hypothetical protein
MHIEGMLDTFFKEFFINGLKEEICAQVLMVHPTTLLEASQRALRSPKGGESQAWVNNDDDDD